MIYIETLELKFCGLDYELKKNIDRRGNEDIIEGFDLKRSETDDDLIELIKSEDIDDNNQDKIPKGTWLFLLIFRNNVHSFKSFKAFIFI